MRLSDLVGRQDDVPGSWAKLDITGLTADSRDVEQGYLFAALPGSQTDGAKFIEKALRSGAAAILVPKGVCAGDTLAVPVIEEDDPRRVLARMAARFYESQPEYAAAVTGTNGKTSVVSFLQQIWRGLGFQAASLGTVGLESPSGHRVLGHTTPDPVMLHRLLADIAGEGFTHFAVEASSHG